ncbi:MAG: LacI family transcriptional regulator [Clostridiales bacterium]|nr:LacI family transcriptional regulator [Clostridiales bacterium]MDO4349435.1 LacI family DNA-binding transcriptional regulator [Eubacteriales bacterium]MDY4008581.1 LacI family DNA-binding transcriptional regulator [Candidatus Limiplasma sp.]
MKRVSIKDVAREAGVSASTVSYVLNCNPSETISAETTQRVREAAKRLNYVPNLNARSLSSRRSNLIGVVIPQTEPGKEFMFSNPFYGELLSAIEYTARTNGYHLLLSGTKEDQSYLNVAQNRGLDGVIIVGAYPGKNLAELRGMNVPVVLVDSYVKDETFHTVGNEDRQGARMATEYLLAKGHRRIAFVSGSIREHGVNSKRYQGYLDALLAAGIEPCEQALYSDTVSFEYGVEAANEFVRRGKKQTAAFVTADVLAMGMVKGLMQRGMRIPQDLSIVGFDDVYLAQMCYPSLTTVRQDISRKGREAVRMVIEAAAGNARKMECILPLELVERESVMEWRGGAC